MATYRIFKGFHFSTILCLTSKKNTLEYFTSIVFTEDMKYTIEGENQFDFNKLLGWKGKFFTPRFDTMMVGWRWNPLNDCFEVVPYWHIGSRAYDFDMNKLMQIKVGDMLHIKFSVVGKQAEITMICDTKEITDTRVFTKQYSRFWKINPWFGGDESAPKTIYFKFN
jgi:hypothetical protein